MNTLFRISFWILICICLGLFVAFYASGRQINHEINKGNKQFITPHTNMHFVLIGQELDNPYWRTIEAGARVAAKRMNVTLEYVGPIQSNVEEQKKMFEKAIARRVDGIIVQSIQSDTFTHLIDYAITQNIPIITIDNDAPKSKRFAYTGTNQYEAGLKLGTYIAKHVKKKEKVGIIIGNPDVENQNERLRGLKKGLENNENIAIVDMRESRISRIKAMQEAEIMLLEHPEITIMVGLSALDGPGIIQAMDSFHISDIKVYAFDSVEETMLLIKKGKIEATLQQEPFNMGYNAVFALHNRFLGHEVPSILYTDTHIVTKTKQEP